MSPGSRVASPRSMTSAPAGTSTRSPTAAICPPRTSTVIRARISPMPSKRRAARKAMTGSGAGAASNAAKREASGRVMARTLPRPETSLPPAFLQGGLHDGLLADDRHRRMRCEAGLEIALHVLRRYGVEIAFHIGQVGRQPEPLPSQDGCSDLIVAHLPDRDGRSLAVSRPFQRARIDRRRRHRLDRAAKLAQRRGELPVLHVGPDVEVRRAIREL